MYRFACVRFAFSIQSNLLIAHGIVLSLFCFVLLCFWLAKNTIRRHVKIHAMFIGIFAFFHMIASHIKFQLARMIYLNVFFFQHSKNNHVNSTSQQTQRIQDERRTREEISLQNAFSRKMSVFNMVQRLLSI